MKSYTVLTLFPEMINGAIDHSILGRAIREEIISVSAVNIRDFSKSKQKHVDDTPYGGGAGMVMQAEPIYDAYNSLDISPNSKVIYLTPKGRPFSQSEAEALSTEGELVFLCGHYEGVDQRLIDEIVTDEISIGDFVLTGGELAALCLIDAIARLVPNVLGKEESFLDESFSDGLLEYPQYTRPPEFMGRTVPEVLLSGHHKNIADWRREQSVLITAEKRPDLLETAFLTEKEREYLKNLCKYP